MKCTLAEALLIRKDLQAKIKRMETLDSAQLFETNVRRVNVTDSVDEVTASVSKVTWEEFQKEYNTLAKELRLVDAVIQRTNWETEVTIPE